jgi:hypothetical protein
MGKVTEWKNQVIGKVELKGMLKAVIVSLATSLKLGQTLCLNAVLAKNSKQIPALVAMIEAGKAKDDAIAELAKTVKGTGFESASSMANLFYQLKEDQRSIISELSTDAEGLKALQATFSALSGSYEYTN